MFRAIKYRLDEGGFAAIMTMFDAHLLRGRSADEFAAIVALRRRGIPSVDIRDKFGLGEYWEAACLSVETIDERGFKITLRYQHQPYGLRFEPVEYAEGVPWDLSRMKFFGRNDV